MASILRRCGHLVVLCWMLVLLDDPSERQRRTDATARERTLRDLQRPGSSYQGFGGLEHAHLLVLNFDTHVELGSPWWLLLGTRYYQKLFGGMILLAGVESLYFRIRHRREPALVSDDHVPEVLYLREFRTDEGPRSLRFKDYGWGARVAQPESLETFDARICDMFRDSGRVTAVVMLDSQHASPAGPDDLVRIAATTPWQAVVERLIGGARAILLVLSSSESVLWELKTVVSRRVETVILLSPPSGLSTVWQSAHAVLRACGHEAPDNPPAATQGFVFREGSWTPFTGDEGIVEASIVLRDRVRAMARGADAG